MPAPTLARASTLARKRAAARAALWFERLWPAAWPALGLLGAYACLALLDLPAYLPPWPRLLLPLLVLLGAGVLLWRGLRRVRRPDDAEADRRMEAASGLRHRPLATLADRPAAPTPEAAALWQAHLARVSAQVGALRIGRPRPGLAARDGMALRGALLVGGLACLGIAGPEAGPRLLRAAWPGLPSGPPAPGTAVQAWATPPGYTGLPPVVLRPEVAAVSLPAGARLTVSVTGGAGEPLLLLDGATEPFRALDGASWQADREVDRGGRLLVQRRGGVLASWTVTLVPDRPPTAAFTDPPGPATVAAQPTLQVRLPWRAEDDYGVAGVQAELRLRDRPGAPALVVSAPLAGSPKQARGAVTQDLTAHPWAGLPVVARVVARDAAGQTGASADAALVLPERPFTHPVARAVIAVRRQLSLTPEARREARMMLDALADAPETFDGSAGVLLNLRAASAALLRGRSAGTVDEVQARLWALALSLEEGGAERTARALEAARQALRDAMDPNRDTPADRAELDRRTQELRDAIQRHMEALAEQARREGSEAPFDPAVPQMTARELDRMAERLQQALREGRMDDARREMAEMERLLQQLQEARPETREERERRNAEGRERGRQQMGAVQDIIRREGTLLDRSQGRADTRPTQQQPPQRDADGRQQRAMRRALGELMQRYGDLTGQVPPSLGEADTAMREAGQALANGQDAAAGSAQRRAIEALQRGGREMGQQMARQFGRGPPQPGEGEDEGQSEGDGDGMGDGDGTDSRTGRSAGPRPGEDGSAGRRRSARRDPLGRPVRPGSSGADENGDVPVPDTMEQARTRALQEELRRRGADRTRPQLELDYIDRLLRPF